MNSSSSFKPKFLFNLSIGLIGIGTCTGTGSGA